MADAESLAIQLARAWPDLPPTAASAQACAHDLAFDLAFTLTRLPSIADGQRALRNFLRQRHLTDWQLPDRPPNMAPTPPASSQRLLFLPDSAFSGRQTELDAVLSDCLQDWENAAADTHDADATHAADAAHATDAAPRRLLLSLQGVPQRASVAEALAAIAFSFAVGHVVFFTLQPRLPRGCVMAACWQQLPRIAAWRRLTLRLRRAARSHPTALPQRILSTHEGWFPNSSVLRCWQPHAKTIHYPHGLVGDVVLPFRSDHVLFWNERMQQSFAPHCKGGHTCIGRLGRPVIPPKPVPYQNFILLTSQHQGYRMRLTDNPDALQRIFSLWADALTGFPDIPLIVKLHPNDLPEDERAIHQLLAPIQKQVTLLRNEFPLGDLIAACRIHTTVSSGTVIDAIRYGRPSLICGKSLLIEQNLADAQMVVCVNSADEIARHIRLSFDTSDKLAISRIPDWIDPAYSERQFHTLLTRFFP